MKPIDVKSDSYAEYSVDSNEKGPKFKVDDHVSVSKYKIFLRKDIFQIRVKKFLWLKMLKVQFHGLMLLMI